MAARAKTRSFFALRGPAQVPIVTGRSVPLARKWIRGPPAITCHTTRLFCLRACLLPACLPASCLVCPHLARAPSRLTAPRLLPVSPSPPLLAFPPATSRRVPFSVLGVTAYLPDRTSHLFLLHARATYLRIPGRLPGGLVTEDVPSGGDHSPLAAYAAPPCYCHPPTLPASPPYHLLSSGAFFCRLYDWPALGRNTFCCVPHTASRVRGRLWTHHSRHTPHHTPHLPAPTPHHTLPCPILHAPHCPHLPPHLPIAHHTPYILAWNIPLPTIALHN